MKSEQKLNIDIIIGKILKEYRIKNKFTQEKIAETLGISDKSVMYLCQVSFLSLILVYFRKHISQFFIVRLIKKVEPSIYNTLF